MKNKWVIFIAVVVVGFLAVPFVFNRGPVFTGKQYDSEELTCNIFVHPPTFRDKEGNLITGHTVRYHPNGDVYSKAQMKDGVMHGPFISFWDNGQVQMSLFWDEGTRYKKMRAWDRDGKRLKGTGEEQMQQIYKLDAALNMQLESLDLKEITF